jgi:MFS family permease
MERNTRLTLITHGLIATLLGVLSGIPLAFVITGDIPGEMRSWHQAHLQGIMSGLLALAAASVITHIRLDDKKQRLLAWAFIVQAYGFTLGTICGALTGHRGLEPAPPAANVILYVVYTIASVSAIAGVGLALYGALKSGRSS